MHPPFLIGLLPFLLLSVIVGLSWFKEPFLTQSTSGASTGAGPFIAQDRASAPVAAGVSLHLYPALPLPSALRLHGSGR